MASQILYLWRLFAFLRFFKGEMNMHTTTEIFGSMVFGDAIMKVRLPKDTYSVMQNTIRKGKELELDVANVVAAAMKNWAIEKGATHFTHWFQPLTGITAEKHDSFISPTGDGKIIMDFSGKELVRGEPDASSFPSGGLRATFEARGYTAWDPTSYAFVKDKTLYIPTAFYSYGGEALDKKTPLLRSMEVLQRQALRILHLFGHSEVTAVRPTVGAEQEYFLIDKEMYDRRPDLIYTGRTLFGAKAPKGQELEDHYFGSIKTRVKAFMEELNEELWKLGVPAKTEHNEVAPSQHELAPIYETTNIAADHNQLTMELMQRIARKYDLVCLLNEKPFAGVNGSGKHNNWSICTDTGINLLEPGDTPFENAQFLLFLSAVIKAVDEYQDLLRISVASPGNDHRLGANEAPPAIVSIYVGDELTRVLKAIEEDVGYNGKAKELMRIGVDVLPRIPKDSTDRNRTSPFAFTGNKFEFRMLGSNASVSDANTVLNTAVAQELGKFADILEASGNFKVDLHNIVMETVRKHKRILFSGNGYDQSWVKEAEERGLSNLRTTPDALAHLLDEKNVKLLTENRVLSESELHSRYEIMLENYCKVIAIEALTMIQMTRASILPAVTKFRRYLADTLLSVKAADENADLTYEKEQISKLSTLSSIIYRDVEILEKALAAAKTAENTKASAAAFRDSVIPAMSELRIVADETETIMAKDFWPYPGYGEILFGVR